jgi:hypothetical protein
MRLRRIRQTARYLGPFSRVSSVATCREECSAHTLHACSPLKAGQVFAGKPQLTFQECVTARLAWPVFIGIPSGDSDLRRLVEDGVEQSGSHQDS